jgi:hypothetical protein
MTKNDLLELESVIPLYSMCGLLRELIDEVLYGLPEDCKESVRTLEDALKTVLDSLDAYQASKQQVFLNACEDGHD